MGLIRFLFFLLIIWVVWFMAKNYLRKQQQRSRAKDQQQVTSEKIVQCKHCEIHLPELQAVREGNEWFCTPAHRQAWLDRTRNGS